jgi:hypothetical protein
MPSTYSTSLKLQLIGTGEQAGTWGTTTNTNLGTLLEEAITGVITIPMGDATYTLTNFNGLSDEARNAVLILNGPITAPQLLVAPSGQEKVYIVRNRTGNTVTLTTGSGSNVNIANAASEVVFTDGANFFSATQFNYIDGDLTVTGNASVGKNLVVLQNASFSANIYANSSTGQIFLPTGNTASRAANGSAGIFRYNSELAIYEGYSNGTWVRFQTFPQGVYTINFLIVAGGGGAYSGGSFGAGGGGGGFKASSLSVTPGATYTMVIGAGGSGGATGTNSSITGVDIASGGGIGGATQTAGGVGGSGGGGGSGAGDPTLPGAGGAGISGQGFAGGSGATFASGGGGGGSAVGGSASGDVSGAGGTGYLNTLTGSNVYYSGGGGGGSGTPGGGGNGGGGAGNASGSGSNGGTNTGGGGGGGNAGASSSGGSGVIIVSVPTTSYSGTTTGSPTITVSGANTILKYTTSGTYTA